MSCRTWNELTALGDALLVEDSTERARAESHFESCPACAERAFLLDPGWALRRSPAADFSGAEIEELELRSLRAGRLRDIERSVGAGRWRSLAATVAIAIGLAAVAGVMSLRTQTPPTPAPLASLAQEAPVAAAGEFFEPAQPTLESPGPSASAIGSVAPAAARVYEIGGEDVDLVMVVHETLDL